jgi:hypothetical protein
MKVTCDISDVISGTRAAGQEMQNWPRTVEDTLRLAAQDEKRTSTYKNQTGHLRQGTRASTVEQTDNTLTVDLEMGGPYASFVVKRGFSTFPKIAKTAERALNREAESTARRLGRL